MKLKKFKILGPAATVFGAVNTGAWRLEYPEVDTAVCVKCGVCSTYCPVDAITVDKSKKECIAFAWDYCKGCGICANECPKGCIRMIPVGGER